MSNNYKSKSGATPSESTADKISEIYKQLEGGIQSLYDSDRYKKYLDVMSRFHRYSPRNSLLIYMQNPDASHVAGYGAWRKDFNRQVKKGEKGMKILAPIPIRTKEVPDKDATESVKDVKSEEGLLTMRFKVSYVFDVSQTDGPPLPSIASRLQGDVADHPEILNILKDISPVPVYLEAMSGGKNGYYSPQRGLIAVREGLSEAQIVKTLIHEIVHARLHNPDLHPDKTKLDRSTKEVEAESVAYIVCQHLGLDASEYSFGYIAGWGQENLEEFKASLNVIQKEAGELICAIDEHFPVLGKEKTKEEEMMQTTMHNGKMIEIPDFESRIVLKGTDKIPLTWNCYKSGEVFSQYGRTVVLVENLGSCPLQGEMLGFTCYRQSGTMYESKEFENNWACLYGTEHCKRDIDLIPRWLMESLGTPNILCCNPEDIEWHDAENLGQRIAEWLKNNPNKTLDTISKTDTMDKLIKDSLAKNLSTIIQTLRNNVCA
ncbi:MAG: ArdC-like ssDNA-binding domain-containing protein [Defluviitaleaceae bacterium]|nr:ArdC-like ssDNA-binding domain-containing protein [Defluviitaleaceae bacterium]